MDHDLFVRVAYAVGIGLLVGLERSRPLMTRAERRAGGGEDDADPGTADHDEAATSDDAAGHGPGLDQDVGDLLGVRTYSVISLVGFGAALLGERMSAVPPVVVAGVCGLIVVMYIRTSHRGPGITTEAAAIATCLLGMLCHHQPHAAGVLALVLTVLLAAKRFTHTTIRKMRPVELTDTLKFLVIILIVLPLLPNRALDPYGAFNPYKVGFLVVLISGISFVGYFLTRILGAQKGLGLTGILGGLTSSTAVTAAMANEAKAHPELRAICAFSTVAANATMFLRVVVVVAVLDRELVMRLAWAVGTMCAVAALAAGVLWWQAARGSGESAGQPGAVPLKNPFSIGPALKFGGFFVGILFAAKLAKIYLGNRGLYAASVLSGLADVDAITLSLAEQAAGGSLARDVAAIGIIIAVVSNSLVKSTIAIYSGGWRFGRLVGACLMVATGAGLGVVFLS